jgi:DNA-binding beta-propeller fold protein YncE
LDTPFGSENIGCSEDGRFIFLSTLITSKDMSIVDTETDTIISRISLDHRPSGFSVSPINPSLIYVRHFNVSYENGFYATDDGYLQEVNIQTNQIGRQVKTGKHPLNIIITKDGKQAYLSCGMSHRIDIIDLEKMEIIRKIDTALAPHGIAFVD